jgi:hypothetical protein
MSAGKMLWFVMSAVLVGVFVTGILFTQFVEPASRPPAPAPVANVDVSDLPAFWELQYSKASWYPLSSVPSWDGNVLTAKTTLVADADAVEPAKSICVAMSMYWLQSKDGQFRSVRVVDQAGQVLVSRHTEADQCTWRR